MKKTLGLEMQDGSKLSGLVYINQNSDNTGYAIQSDDYVYHILKLRFNRFTGKLQTVKVLEFYETEDDAKKQIEILKVTK